MFGSLKIIEIGIPFSFGNFTGVVVNLVLSKFGISIVLHNDHSCSKLPLVRLVHLLRNVHEEGLQFLNIKSARVLVGKGALKVFR